MDKIKKILFLLTPVFIVLFLGGCGVSKDEYNKVSDELNQTKTSLEQAKAKISEMEKTSILPRPETDIVEKLGSVQKHASQLNSRVERLTSENEMLKENLEKMKNEVENLQKKLKAFSR